MELGRPTPVHAENADAAAQVLAAALHDDPGFTHLLPEPQLRHDALRAFYGYVVRDAFEHGKVLAVRDASGIAGVAVWYPPGAYPMSLRRKLGALPAMTWVTLRSPARVLALERLGADIDAAFPSGDTAYLEALGVRPDAQRHGHGHALMDRIVTESERARATCYLETSQLDNVRFYEAWGFAPLGAFAPLRRGGPAETRMLRAQPPPDPDA